MISIQFIKILGHALKKKNVICSDTNMYVSNNQQTLFTKLFIRRKKTNLFLKDQRTVIAAAS